MQCSTDDEEFQEVSEDENNAASILDQGERIQPNGSGMDAVGVMGMDQIDVSHIKTEMKIEPPQLANGE